MGTFVEESFLDTRLNASKNACKYSAQILRRYSPPNLSVMGAFFLSQRRVKYFPKQRVPSLGLFCKLYFVSPAQTAVVSEDAFF